MYIETRSAVEDGKLTDLRKLKIEGTEDELKKFAFSIMDAIDAGKAKFMVDETKVIVKVVDET